MKRRIVAATFARSDFGALRSTFEALRADPEFEPKLIVSGSHLDPRFGSTVEEVKDSGITIDEQIDMAAHSDSPAAAARSIGIGTIAFADSFAQWKPDILLLIGDRYELLAPVAAATALRIPIAHVSGGEITEGAFDNQVRHAVSKLASVHFVGSSDSAARLLQMGEEPWRVHVTGDPGLDLVRAAPRMSVAELEGDLGIDLSPPVLVVTFHAATLGAQSPLDDLNEVLAALENFPASTVIITYPGADPGGRALITRILAFAKGRNRTLAVPNLGAVRYYSLLDHADALIGNSSSGIWEAPSFCLPAVDIGDRQKGRLRAENVIHVDAKRNAIVEGIKRSLDPAFRHSLDQMSNPYGDGHAAERIVAILRGLPAESVLLQKRFCEINGPVTGTRGDAPHFLQGSDR